MADSSQGDRPTYTAKFIHGDWDKAVYLDNAHVDNLMTAYLSMGAELWTVRRRMMVLEQFLAEKKVVDLAKLEAYEPPEALKAAWDAERDDYIQRMFAVLTRETDAPVQPVPLPIKGKS
jgi:hypothetical protein